MLRLANPVNRACRISYLCRHKRALSSLSSETSHSRSTVNKDEIAHFSRLSSLWWDEQGEFHLLHKMNPIRMQFIQEKMVNVLVYGLRMTLLTRIYSWKPTEMNMTKTVQLQLKYSKA